MSGQFNSKWTSISTCAIQFISVDTTQKIKRSIKFRKRIRIVGESEPDAQRAVD